MPVHNPEIADLFDELADLLEIADMEELIETSFRSLRITQDLGIGMMLWMSHFFASEPWAELQRDRCLAVLDGMWIDPPGYFCRQPGAPDVKFAFTNYGVSIGLRAVGTMPDRVASLDRFFTQHRSGDEYDTEAITHVMARSSAYPGELLLSAWRDGDHAAQR